MNEDFKKRNDEALRKAELAVLEPIDYATLEKEVKKVLLVEDTGIIKLLLMIIISNRLPRDPIWLFLIGASGGGKTEFLSSLFDLPDVYAVSLLTPNTLLSGAPGRGDMSLLPKVNGKILMFKDWTYFMSQNKDAKNEIMGQLREVYDGYVRRPYGNGKIAEWRGKVGLVAGTTPVIDISHQVYATLGERFIHYRLIMPGRKEVAMKALLNSEDIENKRKSLRNAFFAYFKGFTMPEKILSLPHESCEEIVKLANFATMARSGVIRESSYRREVVFVPAVEMPTRISGQLNTLAVSAMIINDGVFSEKDMDIIYKIALDSIPQTNKMVMVEMAKKDNQNTSEIATALGYPTPPIRMYLENLALLGVCKRKKGSDTEEGGTADRWNLDEEFAGILRKYDHIAPVKKTEEEIVLEDLEKAWEEIK